MKKHLKFGVSLITSIAIIGSFSFNAFAAYEETISQANVNQREISFSTDNYYGLSDIETGKRKLIESGHSEEFINTIPDETLSRISASPECYQTEKYMAEVNTDNDVFELISVTEEDYMSRIHNYDFISPSEISVVDESGTLLHEAGNVSAYSVNQNVDSGAVKVLTSFYSVQDPNYPSRFLVVSEFQWTTMPKYRGDDFFGITKDTWTSIIPGTFGSYYAFNTDKYWYYATNTGVAANFIETQTYRYDNLPNEDASNPAKGFAFKMAVPNDILPPPQMLVGASANVYYNYLLTGGCYFEGVVSQPTLTTNFNLWTTYLHQNKTSWIHSPTVYFPLSGSLTIEPVEKYSDPVVDTIMVTWRVS